MPIAGGGAGASATAVRAGRAFVEILAKDDGLRKTVDAAKARVLGLVNTVNGLAGRLNVSAAVRSTGLAVANALSLVGRFTTASLGGSGGTRTARTLESVKKATEAAAQSAAKARVSMTAVFSGRFPGGGGAGGGASPFKGVEDGARSAAAAVDRLRLSVARLGPQLAAARGLALGGGGLAIAGRGGALAVPNRGLAGRGGAIAPDGFGYIPPIPRVIVGPVRANAPAGGGAGGAAGGGFRFAFAATAGAEAAGTKAGKAAEAAKQLDRQVREAAGSVVRLGSAFGSLNTVLQVGAGLLTKFGIGLSGLAVGGGLFAKLGVDKLNDLAKQGATAQSLGLTAEQFTGIAGLAKSAGEDTREFIESLVTMGKVIQEGALGKGEQSPQFFKDIGQSAKEFAGLRADEAFFRVFEAVRQIEDPLTKVRSLMVAFGEDGGKYLLPLLSKSPAELRRMAAGFAASTAEVQQAQAAQLSFATAAASLDRVWRSAVVGLAPAVERAADALARAAGPVGKFVAENKELVVTGIAVASAVGAAGVAVAALTPAVAGGVTILGTLVGAAGSVAAALGPSGIAVAAVVGLYAHLMSGSKAATELGEAAGDAAKGIGGAFSREFDGLQQTFGVTWGGISDALKSGDIARAAEIGFGAMEEAWARSLRAMREAWERFKFGMSEARHAGVDTIAQAYPTWKGNAKATAAWFLQYLPEQLGGMKPEDREKFMNSALQKIQAQENQTDARQQTEILREIAAAAKKAREEAFEAGLREVLKEYDRGVTAATYRKVSGVIGGSAGAMALGGGMLAGIGLPSANAQAIADGVNRFFPKKPPTPGTADTAALLAGLGATGPLGFSAAPLGIAAGLAGNADLMRRLAAAGEATKTTIVASRGMFGAGADGLANRVFGGAVSPVQAIKEQTPILKKISEKLVDIDFRIQDIDGPRFT